MQSRMRVMLPTPQVTEQEDHGDQWLQPPSCRTSTQRNTETSGGGRGWPSQASAQAREPVPAIRPRPADEEWPLTLTSVVTLAQAARPRLDGRPQAGVAGDVTRPPSLLGARPAGGRALGPLRPGGPALLTVQCWWEAQGPVGPLPTLPRTDRPRGGPRGRVRALRRAGVSPPTSRVPGGADAHTGVGTQSRSPQQDGGHGGMPTESDRSQGAYCPRSALLPPRQVTRQDPELRGRGCGRPRGEVALIPPLHPAKPLHPCGSPGRQQTGGRRTKQMAPPAPRTLTVEAGRTAFSLHEGRVGTGRRRAGDLVANGFKFLQAEKGVV